MPSIGEGIKAWSNDYFRRIGRHWMLILWRTLEKDNSTIVQPLSPLIYFVSAIVQEQQLWLRWYSFIHGMDLKLFLHTTITKSSNRSFVIWSSFYNDSILMCWRVSNISLTPLYKGVKTCYLETKKTKQLFHIKVHLEFLNNFHILEILES